MKPKRKRLMEYSALLAIFLATGADAASINVSCSFEECSAQISQLTLQVSCKEKSIYNGPYELSTDLQSVQIQSDSDTDTSIKITTQMSLGIQAKMNSTLMIADKAIAGSCSLRSN